MRTVLHTIVLGLAVAGCTGGAGEGPDAATTPTRPSASASEPDPAGSEPAEPRTDGPLRLDDSRGKACASLRYGHEYTVWEHVLEPDEDVELTGIRLVGARRVRAPGQAWVSELPRKAAATGFTLGFPPSRDDVDSRLIDWEGRRPALGATLAAGTSSNFWVRIQVDPGARRAQYRGLELSYTSGGQEFTAFSDIRTRFRWRCF